MAGKGQPKTGGRKKGSQNKVSRDVAWATLEALDRLGGVEWLVKLGQDEPATFAGMLRKHMPQVVEASVKNETTVKIVDLTGK